MRRKEVDEIKLLVKKEVPGFDRQQLLDYVKIDVESFFNYLNNKDKQNIQEDYKESIISKVMTNKEKYRIQGNIDRLSIQYAELYDYIKQGEEIYLKIYISGYFYDNICNNGFDYNLNKNKDIKGLTGRKALLDIMGYQAGGNEKYWNDIWIVTYKMNKDKKHDTFKCTSCGAIMKYDKTNNILKCDYCGGIRRYRIHDSIWEIDDIEVL